MQREAWVLCSIEFVATTVSFGTQEIAAMTIILNVQVKLFRVRQQRLVLGENCTNQSRNDGKICFK